MRCAKISSCSSSDRKGRALKRGSRAEAKESLSFRPMYLEIKLIHITINLFFPHDHESLIKRSKYLFWRSWCTADFISFTITESSGASCISSRSLALRGAVIDRVGVPSWDITKVAFFSGFRACATSSAAVMSASVREHRSFSCFHTKNLSSMSKALFQRVGKSVTRLCCGRSSNFCFFLRAWLAKVLRWKKSGDAPHSHF